MGQSRPPILCGPARGMFMDARQSSRLTRMFVPVDPDNPCRQWQAMAKLAGVADQGEIGHWRCERVGEETIGGTATIAYRATSAPGQEFFGWIDPARKFPLRIRPRTVPHSPPRTFATNRSLHNCSRFRRVSGNSIRRRSIRADQAKRRVGRPIEQFAASGSVALPLGVQLVVAGMQRRAMKRRFQARKFAEQFGQ